MKSKQLTALFLTIIMFVFTAVPACAASPEDENLDNSRLDIISSLVNLGIPEDFLELRSDDELRELYDVAQSYVLSFSSEEAEYNNNDNIPFSTIPSSSMTLTISQIAGEAPSISGQPRPNIEFVWLFIDYNWANGKPAICREDAITVNWNSSEFVFEADSFYCTDYATYAANGTNESHSYADPAFLQQGGLGYYADLGYFSYLAQMNVLTYSGSASLRLLPKTTIYSGTGHTTQFNVDYTHDKRLITQPLTFQVGYKGASAGVSVTPVSNTDSVGKAVNMTYSTTA